MLSSIVQDMAGKGFAYNVANGIMKDAFKSWKMEHHWKEIVIWRNCQIFPLSGDGVKKVIPAGNSLVLAIELQQSKSGSIVEQHQMIGEGR